MYLLSQVCEMIISISSSFKIFICGMRFILSLMSAETNLHYNGTLHCWLSKDVPVPVHLLEQVVAPNMESEK